VKIYTIGHSNLSYEKFISLLKPFGIEAVADVRSKPASVHARWSAKKKFEQTLKDEGIEYNYFGNELGGLPFEKIADFYERERSPLFVVGIQRLIDSANKKLTVILCSEARPEKCHRKNIIGRHLVNRGWEVIHILRDGTTESQEQTLL
jgi:uncharacterized protein (DUF488 family)